MSTPLTNDERSPLPGEAATPPPRQAASAPAHDDDDAEREDHSMPLLAHLGELRSRMFRALIGLLVGFFACYAVVDVLYAEIIRPLEVVLPPGGHMIFTVLHGPFFVQLKIALLSGLLVASPYIFYQIWAFIAPGLYVEERKYIVPLAIISALFFLLGAAFCYMVVLPFAFRFFLSYSTDVVVAQPDIVLYFNFVLKLILAFGLIFEMPLFALFLARLGLITATKMRKTRGYAILAIFIVAAILTPPDPFTQILMAIPMLALYELSIVLAATFGRKPGAKTEPATDGDNGRTPPPGDIA